MLAALALLAALAWAVVLFAPLQVWRNRELLSAHPGCGHDLSDITVLIPARDEAALLPGTLRALARQGHGLDVVLVDDASRDGTAAVARATLDDGLRVVDGQPLPAGWSGKVWAQHQGEAYLDRALVLLLDADIELAPGLIAALRDRLRDDELALASIMARLPASGFWERLLVPPFVYFFKLVYPFALSNDPRSPLAAAAGGCILLRRDALAAAGGFAALADALIDDCTLARNVKRSGARTWIGQSRDVVSRRPYAGVGAIWDMVARTAFTQLRYSPLLLLGCTAAMLLCFCAPLLAIVAGHGWATAIGVTGFAMMLLSFVPTLVLLEVPATWALTLPVAAVLFLAMTWSSALRYWRGERSRWRGRSYRRDVACG